VGILSVIEIYRQLTTDVYQSSYADLRTIDFGKCFLNATEPGEVSSICLTSPVRRAWARMSLRASMFCRFTIGLSLTAVFVVAVSAQPAATSGAIRCESCALTRQKLEPFDPAKVDTVARVEPVFLPGALTGSATPQLMVRTLFIARVLGTSPLRLEMLDSRAQRVDRNTTVVVDDVLGGKDPGTCGIDLWGKPMAVSPPMRNLCCQPFASTIS